MTTPSVLQVTAPVDGMVAALLSLLDIQGNRTVYSVKDYGARGDGVTDDTSAIQLGINSVASAGGGVLFFPAGTYRVATITPFQTGGVFYPTINYILEAKTGVSLVGADPWTTTIKLGDSILTNPDNSAGNGHMLQGRGASNLMVRNLHWDGNGPNNIVPSGSSGRNAMGLRFTSLFATPGQNVFVDNCRFSNIAGNNCVAFTHETGNVAGKMCGVRNCIFLNGGRWVGVLNPYNTDHSCVYCDWDDFWYTGNHTSSTNPDESKYIAFGGVELHGSRHHVASNTFVGCQPAVYLASQVSGVPVNDAKVEFNTMENCQRGVVFWADIDGQPFRRTRIAYNTMTLRSSQASYGGVYSVSPVVGVEQMNGGTSSFTAGTLHNASWAEGLDISHNRIEFMDPTEQRSGVTYQGMSLHSIRGGIVSHNKIINSPQCGVRMHGSPWGLDRVTFDGNEIIDCGQGTGLSDNFLRTGFYCGWFVNGYASASTPLNATATGWFYVRDITFRDNTVENTVTVTRDATGAVTNIVSVGRMYSAVSFPISSQNTPMLNKPIERVTWEGNNRVRNVAYRSYGGAAPLAQENQHPEIRVQPTHIPSAVKPVTNLAVWLGDLVQYQDGTRLVVTSTTPAYLVMPTSGTVVTGSMTSGSAVLTVNVIGGFVVGQTVNVGGAGAAGATLTATVTAIGTASSTALTVTLSAAASTTVSGVTVTMAGMTTATTTVGSYQVTVGSTLGLKPGMAIQINGAGAGGANLFPQIKSLDSLTQITLETPTGAPSTAVTGAVLTVPAPAMTALA